MEYGLSYIARDRGRAIAAQRLLPDYATGAVLSADIAGFTPLTAQLSTQLGPQRGAEELTQILNQLYTALIAVVDHAGGSVIGFSGDAITCWFDADDGVSASACGLALQTAMRPFAAIGLPAGLTVSLRLKVAIAAGAVRRFLVGDPAIQYLDVIAGDALERLAEVEALARPDEVALEVATAIKLSDQLGLRWVEAAGEQRYAVIKQALAPPVAGVAGLPWPGLTQAQVQPWMLPAVARFHDSDHGLFTELRPAVALFMAFDGLDYTHAAGAALLNRLICHVQRVIAQYDGTVLQVTVGDKGSYLYAAFGAPTMHEDDPVRAVHAASALRSLALADFGLTGVRFGLSQGIMRVGVYGSAIRRTYGVLGDAANVAARLMQQCRPGQLLASSELQALAPGFAWQTLGPLQLKGKAAPLAVVSLDSQGQPVAIPPRAVTLPMIGREREFARLTAAVSDVGGGAGKVVGITGEAGIGKSRLVAELLALLGERGWIVAQGECQSYATNTPYMVWHDIWRSLFGLDGHLSSADQIATLERSFAAINPDLLERIPLLGPVVNLSIADNDLTRALPAKLQRESREALLLDYLRAQAASLDGSGRGIALVLEDCHWVDPLSRELLQTLARIIPDLPILIVATYRPAADPRHPLVLDGIGAEEYSLVELDQRDIARFLSAKLAQVTGQSAPAIPAAVVAHVATRTSGNPFYIGELVQYLVTLGFDPSDPAVWSNDALPDSLQRLILSRIDQLTTYQQRTIKLSSVLGRLVRAQWLHGAYPSLGRETEVYQALETLHQRDLMLPTDQEDVEYLFKHIITQDVTYHSLTHATRLALHEQFGQYLERIAADEAWAVDLLAYHYGQTENLAKKRLYLGRAGDAARASYANDAAVSYYRRLLPLLDDPIERGTVLQSLGEVLDVTSEWSAAIEVYQEALELAISSDQLALHLHSQHMLGMLYRKQGTYPEAVASLSAAQAKCVHHNDTAKLMEVILEICHMYVQQGSYDQAKELIQRQLVLANELGNQRTQAISFGLLGMINYYQGSLDPALYYLEQSLALHRQRGDVVLESVLLSQIGAMYAARGEHASAQEYYQESLQISQRIGNKLSMIMGLANLAIIAQNQQDYALAIKQTRLCLDLSRDSGNRRFEISMGIQLGRLYMVTRNYLMSREYNERYLIQAHNLGDQMIITHVITNLASLEFEEGHDERAWDLLKDCLTRALGIGYQLMIGYALVKAAAVAGQVAARSAADQRRFSSAVQLLSAGSALLAVGKIVLEVYEQGLSDTLVAAAQAQLSSAEYAAAWESGQQMAAELKLADVIALAESAIVSE